MTINGNPDYFSLNLSQAVQVVCYELFSQVGAPMTHLEQETNPATQAQIAGMVAHLESVMNDVGFFNRRNSERLMRRMQNLFARANTETEDIDISARLSQHSKTQSEHRPSEMNYALDALWWRLTDPNVRDLAAILTAPPLWHSGCELPLRELLGETGFRYLLALDSNPRPCSSIWPQKHRLPTAWAFMPKACWHFGCNTRRMRNCLRATCR